MSIPRDSKFISVEEDQEKLIIIKEKDSSFKERTNTKLLNGVSLLEEPTKKSFAKLYFQQSKETKLKPKLIHPNLKKADSSELKKWGVTAGLTNFSAAYATGLLTSRRLLKTLDKENKTEEYTPEYFKLFDLVQEADGSDFDFNQLCMQKDIGYRPFTCYLDLGLVRATRGNRVFAAMKGAIDGGVNIPHNPKIFPQKKVEKKKVVAQPAKKGKKEDKKVEEKKKKEDDEEGEFDGSVLRDRIFGKHVQTWMDQYAKKKDKQDYQFSQWKKCLKDSGCKDIESLYKKVHAEIRKNPDRAEKKKEELKYKRKEGDRNIVIAPNGKEFRRDSKLTNKERKDRVADKIQKFAESRKK